MTNRIAQRGEELPSEAATRRLHAAGWSVGEVAAGSHWLVNGTNGENRVHAVGESQAAAWELAIEQAGAVGIVVADHSCQLPPGDICASEDADIDQVSNLQAAYADLVTLHLYSPPLLRMDNRFVLGGGI
jgi:hypothetical protein